MGSRPQGDGRQWWTIGRWLVAGGRWQWTGLWLDGLGGVRLEGPHDEVGSSSGARLGGSVFPTAPDSVAQRRPTQGPTRHRWPGVIRLECLHGGGGASGGGKHGGRGAEVSGEASRGTDDTVGRRRRWVSKWRSSPWHGRHSRMAMTVGERQVNARWRRQKCKVATSKCEGRKKMCHFQITAIFIG
jgi:hypothetical protein